MTPRAAEKRADELFEKYAYNKPTNTTESRVRFGKLLEALLKRYDAPRPAALSYLQGGGGFVRDCTRDALLAGVPEQEIRTLFAFCFT